MKQFKNLTSKKKISTYFYIFEQQDGVVVTSMKVLRLLVMTDSFHIKSACFSCDCVGSLHNTSPHRLKEAGWVSENVSKV